MRSIHSNKFITSIFFEDEFKINHSFNSDIHLKNNKNFIPKEQLMTKKTEPILIHRSKSDKSVTRFLNEDEKTPKINHISTLNYYTSVNTGFKDRSHCISQEKPKNILSKFNSEKNISKHSHTEESDSNTTPVSSMNVLQEEMNGNFLSFNPTESKQMNNHMINIYNNNFIQPQLFFKNDLMNQGENLNNYNRPINLGNNQMNNNMIDPNQIQRNYFYSFPPIVNNPNFEYDKLNQVNQISKPVNYSATIDDLFTNANYYSRDQNGCRYLQRKIEENPNFGNLYIFPMIKNDLFSLSNDTFGNYLVQKVLETLDEDNLMLVLEIFKPNILVICINTYGTRVVQKTIEHLFTINLVDKFIKITENIIMELMQDINGNHVIQKIVSSIKKNEYVYDFLMENFYVASKSKFGCCAMQKCIEYANSYYKDILIDKIVNNTPLFMVDQYANYVLQFIICMNIHEINRKIINFFIYNIENLAILKFASNVIEKVFDYCDEYMQEMMVIKLADPQITSKLILDMYGNYVIQKALSVAKEPYRSFYIQNILLMFDRLKLVGFGTKLCQRLINTYSEFGFLLNQRSFNRISNNINHSPMEFNPFNYSLLNNFPNNYQNSKTIEDARKKNVFNK